VAETAELTRTQASAGPAVSACGLRRVLFAALALAAVSACYNPRIPIGGFLCADVGKPCPDGFVCDLPTNTCRTPGSLTDAAAGGSGGTDAMKDATPDVAEVACFTPVKGCVPQVASGCDPMCQTGCGCQTKCSVSTMGVVACNAPLSSGNRQVGDSCDISSQGMPNQTDNCAPGLVCVTVPCGNKCFAFCRTDADCPNSTCTGNAGGGVKICAVQFAVCDPTGTQAQQDCPALAQGCYVSSTKPDKTICECPLSAQGPGLSCTATLECSPGLTCVDPLNMGNLSCQFVCTLASSCASCPTGRSKALGGSTVYGYCY
jgi:hypothetical protein